MIDPNEKIKCVEVTEPNSVWPQLFVEAEREIKLILQENCIEIYHIGSTAIPNIYAKPIVDVLPVVKDIRLVDSLNSKFERWATFVWVNMVLLVAVSIGNQNQREPIIFIYLSKAHQKFCAT